ncbi:MAG: Ig-like domain-containing protein [Fimbriimonadaceae bacterium]|nr:Ig-like domain-containing protein [Fimbriimonadaceae bacterium]
MWLASTVAAWAGTLTVQSPTNNAFLGQSNRLRFQIAQAAVEVTVNVRVTGTGGTFTFEERFSPNADGEVDGGIDLNFGESTPEGQYTITVTATEPDNTYPTRQIPVTIDVVRPQFLELYPLQNQFYRSNVRVVGRIRETNVKQWEVLVNNQPFPGNTGTGNTIDATWNASTLTQDGQQSISVRVTDLANNVTSRTINIVVDRVAPVVTIAYPRTDSRILPGTTIPVLVDITDFSNSSVDVTGITVRLFRMDGSLLGTVARVSVVNQGGNGLRWTGRIRPSMGMPRQFRLRVECIDKAGNRATNQEVTVRVG